MKLFNITIALLLTLFNFAHANELVDTSQNWQTLETDHFRFHYTPEYKQWAISAAHEAEKIRTLIKQQQGRVVDEKVDTYIIDPFNAANGFAIPLSHAPYMTLFATPPHSDSVIANSTGWQQLLILHEYVHLVHLGQKSRSHWRDNLAKWFDLYDASQIMTQRWVSEGYATLLESKLTGRGRLYNNSVEAIIQQFAREGALPSYEQLSNTDEGYLAGAMAYLIGVRYLKWLEENYSEKTLDAVWTRWKAVKQRSFEEAFQGVFQDSAKHLYQRFVAEYTYTAMQKEHSYPKSDASLWLNLKGNVKAPSISPSGKLFAIVEQNRQENEVTLAIYKTTENDKEKEKFNKEAQETVKADPSDIPDKAPRVFKREKAYTLNQINYHGIDNPRWLDNNTIIYGATSTSKSGNQHKDLYRWHINSNTVEVLTKHANIRRFDIVTNKEQPFIIAERNRFGASQLVKLSINGNFTTELTTASLAKSYDFPRIKPISTKGNNAGITFAYLESNLNKKWQLKIAQLNNKNNRIVKEYVVPVPQGYQFLSFPEWSKDGKNLYYVAGLNSETKLYQYDISQEKLTALTSGKHVISWPVAYTKHSLLHLAITSEGPDVYQLPVNNKTRKLVNNTTTRNEITDPIEGDFMAPAAEINISNNIGQPKAYGIGPQKGTITLAGSGYSASTGLLEIGYKSSDALQRFDWQVNISQDIFSNILSGYAGNVRWQGWPVKLAAHAYQFDLKTTRQSGLSLPINNIDEQGIHLQASYPYRNDTLTIEAIAQLKLSEINNMNSNYAAMGIDQTWYYDKQTWGLTQKASVHFLSGKQQYQSLNQQNNTTDDYTGNNGLFTLTGHVKKFALGFDYNWANRSTAAGNILSLGGFNSTLIQPKAHLNKQLAPELAFYRQQGNDFEKMSAYIPYEGNQLFYSQYKIDDNPTVESYGFKGQFTNNFGFTGINNIRFDYGIARVIESQKKSETQAWFGIWHQW